MDGPLTTSHASARVEAIRQTREAQTPFLLIGVVGAVGAGTSWTARVIKRLLEWRHTTAEIVTAREGIEGAAPTALALAQRLKITKPIQATVRLQSIGDGLRKRHASAFVASAMIAKIERLFASGETPGVVICDSLRHPDEARLFRIIYGDAFWLLGTVCDLETRRARLIKKFMNANGIEPDLAQVHAFIEQDQDDPSWKHGQHVASTFEIADYFVDTSPTLIWPDASDTELDAWRVTAELGRFLDLIRGDRRIIRPTDAEQVMNLRSPAR